MSRLLESRRRVEGALPLIVLFVLFALAWSVLEPLAPALLWGVILSVAFAPLHARLSNALGGRRLIATWIFATLMVVCLLLPMVGLSRALLAVIPDMAQWLSAPGRGLGGDVPDWPEAARYAEGGRAAWDAFAADLAVIREHFGEELRPAAFWLIGEGKLLGAFVVEFTLGVALSAILLHQSPTAGGMARSLILRVGGTFALGMADLAATTVRSSVVGVLGSAAVQTILAAVAYVLVEAPHWPVLALATFLLAMIQIGPVLVWGPLALWLWLDGHPGWALFMFVWGGLVVGMSDNVVRTLVLSRRVKLPALLSFLGALGGLLAWGIVGLFIGPVVVAVCHQLLVGWLADAPPEPAA